MSAAGVGAGAREAQRALAREVTALVHGAGEVGRAEHASAVLFGEDITALPVEDVLAVFEDVPSTELPRASLAATALAWWSWWPHAAGGVEERSAAAGAGGGVYVNNRRAADPQSRLTASEAIGGRLFVLRKGSRQTHLYG